MEKLMAFIGIFLMLGLAFLLCQKDRRSLANMNFRLIIVGILLQFAFGLFILKTTIGKQIFLYANDAVIALMNYTKEGSGFLFGGLVGDMKSFGFIFAFQVLPTIIFFSSLMAVLYHLGIMQRVVNAIAVVMLKTMGTSGSESLVAAANIFVGQTEAPLAIRPYLEKLTRSEMMAVMTAGFATIAAGVLAGYVGMFGDTFPEIAGHLICAQVMSAPASLVFAKIMMPETEESETKGHVKASEEKKTANVIEAAAVGASDGLSLAMNVGGMLLAFIALIALINGFIGWCGGIFGITLSLQIIFGWIFAPFAFFMGAPLQDVMLVGQLIGTKTIVNEFVAYGDMAKNIGQLSDISKIVAVYALCGFSNLSSIAIQIGGIGALVPEKRKELSQLGLRAMVAGSLACFQTAGIAAILS